MYDRIGYDLESLSNLVGSGIYGLSVVVAMHYKLGRRIGLFDDSNTIELTFLNFDHEEQNAIIQTLCEENNIPIHTLDNISPFDDEILSWEDRIVYNGDDESDREEIIELVKEFKFEITIPDCLDRVFLHDETEGKFVYEFLFEIENVANSNKPAWEKKDRLDWFVAIVHKCYLENIEFLKTNKHRRKAILDSIEYMNSFYHRILLEIPDMDIPDFIKRHLAPYKIDKPPVTKKDTTAIRPKKTSFLEPVSEKDRIKETIESLFNDMDIYLGWKCAFQNEDEYQLLVEVLTKFFKKDYSYDLPKEKIKLKRGQKTKVARIFNRIHSELTETKLVKDIKYFEIIRTISVFYEDNDLYKTISKGK